MVLHQLKPTNSFVLTVNNYHIYCDYNLNLLHICMRCLFYFAPLILYFWGILSSTLGFSYKTTLLIYIIIIQIKCQIISFYIRRMIEHIIKLLYYSSSILSKTQSQRNNSRFISVQCLQCLVCSFFIREKNTLKSKAIKNIYFFVLRFEY